MKRAALENAAVVFKSPATPSMESFYRGSRRLLPGCWFLEVKRVEHLPLPGVRSSTCGRS